MPRVNIEAKAPADPRVHALSSMLGLPEAVDSLGRLALLWGHCTDEETAVVSRKRARLLLRHPDGDQFLIDVDLAEPEGEDDIRVRGCEGRIDWLTRKRRAGRRGGLARASKAQAQPKHNSSTTSEVLEQTASSAKHNSTVRVSARYPLAPAPALTESRDLVEAPKGASPSPSESDDCVSKAKQLADYLRRQILNSKPDHRLGKRRWNPGDSQRASWVTEFERMHRLDGRDWRRSAELVRWVLAGCPGYHGEFVVESAKALREKWDRIDSAERKRHEPDREPDKPTELYDGYEVIR